MYFLFGYPMRKLADAKLQFLCCLPAQQIDAKSTPRPFVPQLPGKATMFKALSEKLKTFERGLGKSLGSDISTPRARRRAKIHFHLLDHGILRTFWTNLAEIAPGAWRSNQPSQRRLKRYKDMGIKTILNLRGGQGRSPFMFEKEACDALGLTMINQNLHARKLADPEILLSLLSVFETIEKPFLLHCKSGADRAGLASALYLLHIEGASIEEAKKQLSFRFVHVKSFETGILDYMLEAYEKDIKTAPMPIREWIETRYDKQKLTDGFNAERTKS